MADFNKNEYYRFSANLNAQIAIDEEKTKKGDVDAMVRLARYFRTGETVAFDRFEGKDVVSTWFEQQSEDGETYICDQDVIGWYASEKQFNIGKKYAKMAAEAKDARGLYEYSLYLRESLDFNSEYREICDEITELYFKIEYDDCLVPVELDEISKYEEMGIEILHTQDDSSVQKCYRALTPEEKIGREKLDFEISNLNKKRNFIRSEVEKDSLQYLQSAAESGYTDAKIELGIYFANGKWFDQLDTSISREEAAEQDYLTASWYTQKEEKAECATIDDLKFAIECLESVMESEETSKTGLAAITLGRAYANIAKTQSDIDKSVHFYKLAKESNVYATADEMTALFVNNLDAVRLDDIVYLLDKGDEYHNYDIWKDIYKIMESISDEVLKKYSNEFAKVFLKSGKLCCLGDIIVEHVNFYKVVLDNHRLIASRSPLIPIHLVERLDKHLDVEQRVDLYALTFYVDSLNVGDIDEVKSVHGLDDEESDLCYALLLEKNTVFSYRALLAMAEQGNSYAQQKLGRALYCFCNRFKQIIIDSEQGAIASSRVLEVAKFWLETAYNNGSKEALVDLALKLDQYRAIALEEEKDGIEVPPAVFHNGAVQAIAAEDYLKAIEYYKKLIKSSKTLRYVDDLLATYEKIGVDDAKTFVIDFRDWAIENHITEDLDEFTNSNFFNGLLELKSPYYNPLYAIRILQSSEFSTLEGYYKLGCIYSDGEHVEKNYEQALKYFELAANEDVGEAWYRLAYLYYYGDGGNVDLQMAKQCFEKAIFCGFNCEYAYEMVRTDLNEEDESNPMKEYAESLIQEVARGPERNTRIMQDMACEFGEYWEKLNEKTRRFIYSGIKIYVDNYEEDDPYFDYSSSISEMSKSLETLLGEVFYTNYKRWLRKHDVKDIKSYFESLGARVYTENDPFELGVFKRITYSKQTVDDDYETARKNIREDKIPAIVVKNGNEVHKMQLFDKFAEYVDSIFKENAFSRKERMQEITAFVINLVDQVEVIRSDLRNRASHDTLMKAKHVEKCGNILYKTKKVLYGIVSKIK